MNFAGTSAHIGVKLYGDKGKSGRRHLHKVNGFQRGSQEVITIASERYLGELKKIKLWHDNAGLDPDWYLSKVLVIDVMAEVQYIFRANCWFTLRQDRGNITKELVPAGSSCLIFIT